MATYTCSPTAMGAETEELLGLLPGDPLRGSKTEGDAAGYLTFPLAFACAYSAMRTLECMHIPHTHCPSCPLC